MICVYHPFYIVYKNAYQLVNLNQERTSNKAAWHWLEHLRIPVAGVAQCRYMMLYVVIFYHSSNSQSGVSCSCLESSMSSLDFEELLGHHIQGWSDISKAPSAPMRCPAIFWHSSLVAKLLSQRVLKTELLLTETWISVSLLLLKGLLCQDSLYFPFEGLLTSLFCLFWWFTCLKGVYEKTPPSLIPGSCCFVS